MLVAAAAAAGAVPLSVADAARSLSSYRCAQFGKSLIFLTFTHPKQNHVRVLWLRGVVLSKFICRHLATQGGQRRPARRFCVAPNATLSA